MSNTDPNPYNPLEQLHITPHSAYAADVNQGANVPDEEFHEAAFVGVSGVITNSVEVVPLIDSTDTEILPTKGYGEFNLDPQPLEDEFEYHQSDMEIPSTLLEKMADTKDQVLYNKYVGGAVVVAAGGSLVFEQSPLNEVWRTNKLMDSLKEFHNAIRGGLAVTKLTILIEGVSSVLIALGLYANRQRIINFKEKHIKDDDDAIEANVVAEKSSEVEMNEPGKIKRFKDAIVDSKFVKGITQNKIARKVGKEIAEFGLAIGGGAGLVTLKRNMADPEPSFKKDMKTSAKATASVAAFSGGIAWLVGGGINSLNNTILEPLANTAIDIATNTKLVFGAVLGCYAIAYHKKIYNTLKSVAADVKARIRKPREDKAIEAALAQLDPGTQLEQTELGQ